MMRERLEASTASAFPSSASLAWQSTTPVESSLPPVQTSTIFLTFMECTLAHLMYSYPAGSEKGRVRNSDGLALGPADPRIGR
jgi:hypothetical protein